MITPQPLQPLGIGDIIDRSIKLYKVNFLKFISITALPQILIFMAGSLITFVTHRPAGQIGLDLSRIIFILPAFSVGLIGWWLKLLAMGALVRIISEYYLGRVISVKEALGFIFNKWPILLGAIILSSLFTFGGFLLLIIPGLILLFRYIFIVPVVSIEDLGVRASMKRSGFLSRGCAFKFTLIGLCYLAVVSIFSALITLPFVFLGFSSTLKGTPPALYIQIAQNFLQQILELIFSPFWMVALTLLYYDSRIRKEGFDLQVMSQQLGYGTPPSATPAYAPIPSIPITPPPPTFTVPPPAPLPFLIAESTSPPGLSPAPEPEPSVYPPPSFTPPPPPPPGRVTAFNPSPYGAKICPKCGAVVSNISPKCPQCKTPVPFKPGSVK